VTLTVNQIGSSDPAVSSEQLELMKVISSPLRFRIYQTLSKPMSVSELADSFGIERKLLYYHIHVLEKHGLIEVVDTIDLGHLTKSVYQKKPLEFKIESDASPEVKTEACNALVTILMDITNEFREAVTKKGNQGGGVFIKSIMVKSDAFKSVTAEITRLCMELNNRIEEMEDPDGDVEVKAFSALFKK
jgi:DNA-binding transcriptional ArsR family regulator